MIIRPLPGTDIGDLIKILNALEGQAINARASGNPRYQEYLSWCDHAVYNLRGCISSSSLDELVRTHHYWAAHENASALGTPQMEKLLYLELQDRAKDLSAAVDTLRGMHQRWGGLDLPDVRAARFIVADTSVLCHHPDRLDALDLASELDAPTAPVHLVMPIAVIDELDRLKDRGQGPAKTNARTTLRLLNEAFPDPNGIGTLRAADPTGARAAFTVEILFDPPSHRRMEITDDEIVDRAALLHDLSGRTVTVVCGDVGMSMRARARGLNALLLDMPDTPVKRPKSPRGP